MPVMVGRCEQCGGSFELPLAWDPVTWRTDFDTTAMRAHQASHTATVTANRPEPDPTAL